MGNEGKKLLTQYSKESLAFYIQESSSSNWEIRECSCRCINELFKVVEDKGLFAPQRIPLLHAMGRNMDDLRTSVRNYAFVALKSILPLLLEEAPPEFIPHLVLHLADQIPEVRKDTISILSHLYNQPSLGTLTHNHLVNAFVFQAGHPQDPASFHSHPSDLLDGLAMFVNGKDES